MVLAYRVGGLFVDGHRTHPEQWIRWFAGSMVVHDFIVAPLVFATGSLFSAAVERVAGFHASRCPVARSLQGAIEVTTSYELT